MGTRRGDSPTESPFPWLPAQAVPVCPCVRLSVCHPPGASGVPRALLTVTAPT